MKLITYRHPTTDQPRPGAILSSGRIFELPYASTLELIQSGPAEWNEARQFIANANAQDGGLAPEGVQLLAPLQPVSLRDAYAFEQHVKKANENRGREVPEGWYKFPIFYYTHALAIYGTDSPVPHPRYTQSLDYELEIAAIVGTTGKDLTPETAAEAIFGFTIFNDWSARDIQREEMKVGLGPAKGKDFASSFGPCIITVDELADRATGRPGVFDLKMEARVNGEIRSQGNFKDIYWSFGDILARISEEVTLYPGEVIGSGTVGTGCLLELTKGNGPWLKAGDVVELEIEKIGVLRNTIIGK